MTQQGRGKLVIVSGPSGAGKSTVLAEVLAASRIPLRPSVSATTRAPRPGEVDGKDYHFLTKEEFAKRRAEGEFLECFEVFQGGDWYGTLKGEVLPRIARGDWIVLEIDVQGALAVMEQFPEAVSIFVQPGCREELERRLRGRGTESEAAVRRRLDQASAELAMADRYRYRVVNDEISRAAAEICEILESEAAMQGETA